MVALLLFTSCQTENPKACTFINAHSTMLEATRAHKHAMILYLVLSVRTQSKSQGMYITRPFTPRHCFPGCKTGVLGTHPCCSEGAQTPARLRSYGERGFSTRSCVHAQHSTPKHSDVFWRRDRRTRSRVRQLLLLKP